MSTIINNLSLIVNLMIGFAGLVCVIFIVIGGYRIASSSNDPQAYDGGKTTLKNALIGTVIVLFAVPAGNFFVSQVTSGTGSEAPQLVAQRSVGELEAPTITNVVAPQPGGRRTWPLIIVNFSGPVKVYQAQGVKIATSNIGALDLYTGCTFNRNGRVNARGSKASGELSESITLCFSNDTGPKPQTRATQFIFGRGSSIQDVDGNSAVTAFAAIALR
ncbi:MAG: pilin [Chloroflexi bacterium]|nr:pilin [Chloroflexota bacterium]